MGVHPCGPPCGVRALLSRRRVADTRGGDRTGGADQQLRCYAAWLRIPLLVPLTIAGLTAGPRDDSATFFVLLAGYAAWSAVLALEAHLGSRGGLRRALGILLVDLAVLGGLAALSGGSASPVRFAYFLLPMATVLWQRPGITAAVGGLCAVVYVLLLLSDPLSVPGGTDLHAGLQGAYLLWLVAVCTMIGRLLARRAERVRQLLTTRDALLGDALAAEERERAELADALHDGAVQTLLTACQDMEEAADAPETWPAALDRAEASVRATVAELREVVLDLHPQILVAIGLGAALRQAGERAAQRGGFTVDYDLSVPEHVPREQLLYSAAREALTNVVRHARARRVRIGLRHDGDDTVVTVCDDGVGFDPAVLAVRVAQGHIGLASHRVRVESAGGTFIVNGSKGDGVRVEIRLPRTREGGRSA